MKDILDFRKEIENIIEKASREGVIIGLEVNKINNVELMISDNVSGEKCRVRKLLLDIGR